MKLSAQAKPGQIIIRAMSEAAWSQRLLLPRPGRAEVRFSGSSNTHFHLSLCSLSRLAHHSFFYDPAGRWLWKHPRPGPGSQSVSGNLSHCSVLHDSGGGRLPILHTAVVLRHRDERRRRVWQARAEEQDGDRDTVPCGGSRPRQEGKQTLILDSYQRRYYFDDSLGEGWGKWKGNKQRKRGWQSE